jgi:hypothetical protein
VNARSSNVAASCAALAGIAIWIACAGMAGRREAWDAGLYWSCFYPGAIVLSAVFGYLWPERPWRWPLILFVAQFVAMCIRNGEVGNLWPLGVALFALLSLPGIVAARVAALWGSRRT